MPSPEILPEETLEELALGTPAGGDVDPIMTGVFKVCRGSCVVGRVSFVVCRVSRVMCCVSYVVFNTFNRKTQIIFSFLMYVVPLKLSSTSSVGGP